MSNKPIKDIFLDSGALSVADVERAEQHGAKNNKPLHQSIVDLKLMEKMHALSVLAKEWKVRSISLDGMAVDPTAVKMLPDAMERKNLVVPFMQEDHTVLVAVADPAKAAPVLENLRAQSGCQLQIYLALPSDIERELDKVYSSDTHHEPVSLEDQIEDVAAKTREIMDNLRDFDELAQVPQLVDVVNIDASSRTRSR